MIFRSFITEHDEEIRKLEMECEKLKNNGNTNNSQENLIFKIKVGKLANLKKSKHNLHDDKAKLKSMNYSLDTYISNFITIKNIIYVCR